MFRPRLGRATSRISPVEAVGCGMCCSFSVVEGEFPRCWSVSIACISSCTGPHESTLEKDRGLCGLSGVAGQLNLSISSDVRLPSKDGAAECSGTCRLWESIISRTRREGVSRFEGVTGIAEPEFLNFSIVGHADGEGITMEGYRLRFGWLAIFLTEAEAWRGTSASSSVMS